MKLWVGVALLALVGCVSADSFIAPDGRTGYVIQCNGGLQSMAACMNKAAELCGGEYEIAGQNDAIGAAGVMTNGTGSITPARFRTLQAICKKT